MHAALPAARLPLVGRSAHLAEALRLLRDRAVPLLTLTGTGGVGKTRLALAVAAAYAASSPHPVLWVDLAPVTGGELVASAVAQSVGTREEATRPLVETLVDALCDKNTLLVLDNCEHVRAAVDDLLPPILAHSPALRILATSRAPLRLRGEHLLPVPPMALPDLKRPASLTELANVEAVALFGQFACAVSPDFVLTEANAAAVSAICRHLDGLPLALELASAWLRVLSPVALHELLNERLRVLTDGPADAPPRQQTLRAALSWSYELLTPDQQQLLRQLAVFAGGCSVGAIATVTGKDDLIRLLEDVEALVDQSLLVRGEQQDGQLRFFMLETVREFALERLAEGGEEGAAREAHASYFLTLARELRLQREGVIGSAAIALLEVEQPNLLAALDWAVEPSTGNHSVRVAKLVRDILDEMPDVPHELTETIVAAARVHDFGKIAISDALWLGHEPLSPGERLQMQQHASAGAQILARFSAYKGTAAIIRHHHERWDGTGYPDRLSREMIPLGARIISVADTYDAMVSDRPYRKGLPHETAMGEIARHSGAQFDPAVVAAFQRSMQRKGPSRP